MPAHSDWEAGQHKRTLRPYLPAAQDMTLHLAHSSHDCSHNVYKPARRAIAVRQSWSAVGMRSARQTFKVNGCQHETIQQLMKLLSSCHKALCGIMHIYWLIVVGKTTCSVPFLCNYHLQALFTLN